MRNAEVRAEAKAEAWVVGRGWWVGRVKGGPSPGPDTPGHPLPDLGEGKVRAEATSTSGGKALTVHLADGHIGLSSSGLMGVEFGGASGLRMCPCLLSGGVRAHQFDTPAEG
jgi:hypothetical protein